MSVTLQMKPHMFIANYFPYRYNYLKGYKKYMDSSTTQAIKDLIAQGKSREEIKVELIAKGVSADSSNELLDIMLPDSEAQPTPQSQQATPVAQPNTSTTTGPLTPPLSGEVPQSSSTSQGKKSFRFALVALVLLLLSGGGYFAFAAMHKSSASLSCTSPSSSTVDNTNAENVYKTFVKAINQKNQSCVDALSSTYFKQFQSQVFPGSNGQWIVKREGGLTSISDRLAHIPTTFNDSGFKQTRYTQAITDPSSLSASSTSSQPSGLTLSYDITDAFDNLNTHLLISFVPENNKIVVDYFELMPASSDSLSGNSSSTMNGSPSSLSLADAKTLAAANVRTIAIDLEIYFNANNAYPGTIDPTNFTVQGSSVNQDVFTAPMGTKYVYTPLPNGCTTASKGCLNYSLSAVSIVDGSTIVMKQSPN